MGIKIILTALDKKIKLAIDKKGIFYYEWPNYMEWKNIISTYIKEWDDGEEVIENYMSNTKSSRRSFACNKNIPEDHKQRDKCDF